MNQVRLLCGTYLSKVEERSINFQLLKPGFYVRHGNRDLESKMILSEYKTFNGMRYYKVKEEDLLYLYLKDPNNILTAFEVYT